MKIGLISDTHSYLDPKVFHYFKDCDQLWHAGDIGSVEVLEQLQKFKSTLAVYGNIDGQELRKECPRDLHFDCEGLKVWITHIGGRPGRYDRAVKQELHENPPNIFICGHSHILKVMVDAKLNKMLYLNPGAAGNQGFHRVKTLLRFEIAKGIVKNMEVIELGKRGALN
ncbi:MAG: metallophosphoesterase family protein [Cyclobacteriaceae bacterium]